MTRGAIWFAVASAAVSNTSAFASEMLKGREAALVEAAGVCAETTSASGVDRARVARAGWGKSFSAEIDHSPISRLQRADNDVIINIDQFTFDGPEQCSVSAKFKKESEFRRFRDLLQKKLGRAPDSVEADDMRTTVWKYLANTVELWMMPRHELCGNDCPRLFVTVAPPQPDANVGKTK